MDADSYNSHNYNKMSEEEKNLNLLLEKNPEKEHYTNLLLTRGQSFEDVNIAIQALIDASATPTC
eukprot:1919164-Ditylum_brightwellii.AAC.1